jgi:hypothetical protein
VGITVFLGINFVITPPTVSIPKVRGATSNKRISANPMPYMSIISARIKNCTANTSCRRTFLNNHAKISTLFYRH